jgi:hypothetical protein
MYEAVLGYVGGSRQKYGEFVQDGIRQGFATLWQDLLARMVLGDRNFFERLKGMGSAMIKGNAKDQPPYRMIQRVDAEALIKRAAGYFRLDERELTRKRGQQRQERAVVMELLHRYSGLKQRMIGERFGGLDEGLVSLDRRANREKIETEPKVRKWFQDLMKVYKSRFNPQPPQSIILRHTFTLSLYRTQPAPIRRPARAVGHHHSD